NDHREFSLLEMKVRDGEDIIKVIFMGRWLSDSTSKPSAEHPKGIQYLVASTPTNSYFVFRIPLEALEHCNYEIYDSFEWMEESHEVPPCILEDVSYAEENAFNEESEALEA
ncbi:MAG TPA: hypothetical protein VLN47_03550, partial [Clostridiaceae bacterium]|nr:hypothetical protein [Clostridiaceae bacterium]